MTPVREEGDAFVDPEMGLRFTRAVYEDSSAVQPVDLCLVFATEVEEDALHRVLKLGTADHRPYPPSYRRFYRTRYRHRSRYLSIVASKSSDQGSMDMLMALQDTYRHFRPTVTCLVGIAGGLDDDLAIGDVAVAKRVYWYERGKESDEGTSRELIPFTPDRLALQLITGVLGDMRRRRTDFKTALVPYGTGEKVVASELGDVRRYLLTVDRKIGAVEMESGGFFRYFDEPELRGREEMWLVVKGISDHADPAKGDRDQSRAAVNSVRAALDIATGVLIERDKARNL